MPKAGQSDTHVLGVEPQNWSLLICFEEVGLEIDCLSPCDRDGVQKTEILSSAGKDIAEGLPCASSGVFPHVKSNGLSGDELH